MMFNTPQDVRIHAKNCCSSVLSSCMASVRKLTGRMAESIHVTAQTYPFHDQRPQRKSTGRTHENKLKRTTVSTEETNSQKAETEGGSSMKKTSPPNREAIRIQPNCTAKKSNIIPAMRTAPEPKDNKVRIFITDFYKDITKIIRRIPAPHGHVPHPRPTAAAKPAGCQTDAPRANGPQIPHADYARTNLR